MYLIEHTELNRLSLLLQRLDVGDRVIEGRLELFSSSRKVTSEARLSETIHKELTSSPKWRSCGSPSGQMRKGDRDLMVNLISTMNQCFPDYDFSSLTPEDFHYVPKLESVFDTINYTLSYVVEKVVPGFIEDLWNAIREVISLEDADIYSYETGSSADPYSDENCLFSFDFFFYDKKRHRLLFFTCMTKSKNVNRSPYEDDKEEDDTGNSFLVDWHLQDDASLCDSESVDSLENISSPSI
ncbi:hypothetical protein IE077_002201 [Cardiosporidium cionae]|uniref:Repressor of RNA polymerase III transcription n=1 Tax=Cardiosporidium cionae TaxID=476202 RepID=A0ABQ7JB97_9APIC|nr:hypothetical protein IE077_002201 [Cardiosporidium cionae]|eukprot:KAF8821286.1 hypothetical protein IE077_002201 [Cardiosporidium cionae]